MVQKDRKFEWEALFSLVECQLQHVLDKTNVVEPLRSAVTHSVFPGGKRIRPMFALALHHDLGGEPAALVPAAVSLELMHCASLIHDDLPALDNDDMRRGKPSCHKAFGESTAILAGDFLIPLAISELLGGPYDEEQRLMLASELSATFLDLCNGQQLDLLSPEKRGDLLRIHALKTGALFGAAARFAAILLTGAGDLQAAAREAGSKLGIYFQVIDDYLDIHGKEADKGRAGSSDRRNEKITCFQGKNEETAHAILASARQDVEQSLDFLAVQWAEKCKYRPLFGEIRKVIATIEKPVRQL